MVLFYLSAAVFFAGLPVILSSALGYKFNPRAFRFTKTGLIALRTQPAGARVYLDKKLFKDKTPAAIAELLPGRHHLKVVLEDYYPWSAEVNVGAGKVERFEKIILFPTRFNIEKLNSDNCLSFWIDDKRDLLYYLNREDRGMYKLDLNTEAAEKIGVFSGTPHPPVSWKLSADSERLLCFDRRQLIALPLDTQGGPGIEAAMFGANIIQDAITDAFWHSDNYHIIIVTKKSIAALEARPGSLPLTLVNLNKADTISFYDAKSDTVYFLDTQQAGDGMFYDNIYRLDLNTRLSAFRDLLKMRANGQAQKFKKSP